MFSQFMAKDAVSEAVRGECKDIIYGAVKFDLQQFANYRDDRFPLQFHAYLVEFLVNYFLDAFDSSPLLSRKRVVKA